MPPLVVEFQQKDVNDKEYPPLFKFNIIWHISLSSAIKFQCILQLAPAMRGDVSLAVRAIMNK
jgi:hypothetical protein